MMWLWLLLSELRNIISWWSVSWICSLFFFFLLAQFAALRRSFSYSWHFFTTPSAATIINSIHHLFSWLLTNEHFIKISEWEEKKNNNSFPMIFANERCIRCIFWMHTVVSKFGVYTHICTGYEIVVWRVFT